MGCFCLFILAGVDYFLMERICLSWLPTSIEETVRAKGYGRNHQDNCTKTAHLICCDLQEREDSLTKFIKRFKHLVQPMNALTDGIGQQILRFLVKRNFDIPPLLR